MAVWLFIQTLRIHDRSRFIDVYVPAARALAAEFGGRYLAQGPISEVLEGERPAAISAAVIEWHDREAALAFWHSASCAALQALRAGAADISVNLIEGPPDPA